MILELRPGEIKPEGFTKLENGVSIYFKGYVIWENRILSDGDFFGVLAGHFLNGELQARIKEYNGNFIFIIIKGTDIWIGNDRYGIYPLYYYQQNNQFIITNQWQNLVSFSGKQLRKDSVLEILSFGYVLGSKTLIEHIDELNPASLLHFSVQPHGLESEWNRTWRLEHRFLPGKLSQLEKEFAGLWSRQIRYYTDYIRDQGNSCIHLLSGGLDSRLLAHAFDQAGISIHAITYGYGEGSGEIEAAKQIMGKLTNAGIHKILYGDKKQFQKIVDSNVSYDRITNAKNAEKELIGYHELADVARIRIPGYSGDFMAGSHLRHRMRNWRSKQDIIDYVLKFHTTPLIKTDLRNRKDHLDLLVESLNHSIELDNDPVSAFIQWDLDHRQRRYIIRSEVEDNSGPVAFLLPFFDYSLMDFFLDLPMKALLNTRLYTNTQLKYLYKSHPELIRIKRDNKSRQRLIRNNLIHEYQSKLTYVVVRYLNRHKSALFTNWSPEIDWQENIRSWDVPDLVDEFSLTTENVSGGYVTFLLSLAKLKTEISNL